MQPYPSVGGWYNSPFEMEGSFLVNGTSNPDGIRDGNSNQIASVVRESAGLFTVTIAERWALPEQCVTEEAWISPVDATPVTVCACGIGEGAYDPAARTFQILCTTVADTGQSAYFDPAPGDPDDNSRIGFRLKGAMNPMGVD